MKYKLFQELNWKNIKELKSAPTYSSTNQKQFSWNQWSYPNKTGPSHHKRPGRSSFWFTGTDCASKWKLLGYSILQLIPGQIPACAGRVSLSLWPGELYQWLSLNLLAANSKENRDLFRNTENELDLMKISRKPGCSVSLDLLLLAWIKSADVKGVRADWHQY